MTVTKGVIVTFGAAEIAHYRASLLAECGLVSFYNINAIR